MKKVNREIQNIYFDSITTDDQFLTWIQVAQTITKPESKATLQDIFSHSNTNLDLIERLFIKSYNNKDMIQTMIFSITKVMGSFKMYEMIQTLVTFKNTEKLNELLKEKNDHFDRYSKWAQEKISSLERENKKLSYATSILKDVKNSISEFEKYNEL